MVATLIETNIVMEILSQMWSLLGLLTMIQNILPTQLLAWLHCLSDSLQDLLSPHSSFDIPEFTGHGGVDVNDLYRQATLYLNSINPASTCRRLSLSRSKSSTRISYSVAPSHTVVDSFRGHRLSWTHHVDTVEDSVEERRTFTLKLPKHSRLTIIAPYLDHVAARAAEFERVMVERRLFTNSARGSFDSGWSSVAFRHPSTFDTLALEPEMKKQLVEDLTAFADGGEFYKRIGRAWKRGYLLYGPPGAGKSSLIAAMANFLRYDVYDLELSKVKDNSELRALLLQTTNRSIIVIEDIDCSIDLTGDRGRPAPAKRGSEEDVDHARRVTLSGLLSFADGLWSCCGEERVIVFTTSHRGAVDPALLRRGRMDVHVSLGTCGMHAVRALARNYLGLDSHALFADVERCVEGGGALTPAQIGEIMLRNRRDADVAVKAVLAAMQAKILGADVDVVEGCDDVARTHERVANPGLCEWPEKFEGKKRKDHIHRGSCNWESKGIFLVRLKLNKSDYGRIGG
ncbi:AAA-ATPase At4g25835-like [Salvia hispanica]|uniref:AAA-ATPase At4g25835-like n=1 Tax=Salvia hispanica TaxID=49212 RepID=UPI0020090C74|nr:AAA-ATPase At4g25835-like [Salvia hispanica]